MITDGSETQPPQPLSKLLSKKEKLLTITALSGEFPRDNFHRLHISSSYAKLLRHNLYQEGMIKNLYDDCLKGLVLTSKGIEVLKQKEPERYRYISDKTRTEISRRYRRQLFARTYCSLLNADIEFLPDRKPFVFARRRSQPYIVGSPLIRPSLLSDEPVFYSSIEIKYELEDHVQQIRNSAMTGLILCRNNCFVVYNIGENRFPLSYATELKAGIMVGSGTFLEMKKASSNAVFLVRDFSIADELIFGNKEKKTAPSKVILNGAYKHIYLIPENESGNIQLRILCHPPFRELIEDTFFESFGDSNPNYKIINDGFDSDGNPVLDGCFLDVVRLLKFKRGLLTNDIPGRILCFDFQMEFAAKLMKPAKVHINHIKIKDVEEMMNTENS